MDPTKIEERGFPALQQLQMFSALIIQSRVSDLYPG